MIVARIGVRGRSGISFRAQWHSSPYIILPNRETTYTVVVYGRHCPERLGLPHALAIAIEIAMVDEDHRSTTVLRGVVSCLDCHVS